MRPCVVDPLGWELVYGELDLQDSTLTDIERPTQNEFWYLLANSRFYRIEIHLKSMLTQARR